MFPANLVGTEGSIEMLGYTKGTLHLDSGQYCDGEYLLVAVLVTFTSKDGRINFWTKEGPAGGEYRGTIRNNSGGPGTQWFTTSIPLRGVGGGYVEFVQDVEEVVVYCLRRWHELT